MHFLKKHKLFFIVTIVCALGFSAPAYAYLDPGTGSVMLQGVLAGVASVLTILKIYWQRFKKFFRNLFRKKNLKQENPDSSDQKNNSA
jgi:hypothetical protein